VKLTRAIVGIEIGILADGNVDLGKVIGEAGFAALVRVRYDDLSEFEFLFDTAGGTPALEHNVEFMKGAMKRDLSSIEMIILSHGHWDHVAGVLKAIAMAGKPVPVMCHPDALLHKVFISDDGKRHEIGIHPYYSESELNAKTEVIVTKEPYNVAEGIMTTGEVPRTNDFEKLTGRLQKIMLVKDDKEAPDQIKDDLSVIFHMKDDTIVILTGCCHSGIVNTIDHVVALTGSKAIVGIIGGLHLHDASKERLAKTIEQLNKYPLTTIGACHCTGLRGRSALMYAFEDTFKNVGAGSFLKFEVK
jgi:7,8-dihydropterin-6-yl-methyl-4-(beta-D-ribofuranosyl)aminobenzene 5'-phosphate synthase